MVPPGAPFCTKLPSSFPPPLRMGGRKVKKAASFSFSFSPFELKEERKGATVESSFSGARMDRTTDPSFIFGLFLLRLRRRFFNFGGIRHTYVDSASSVEVILIRTLRAWFVRLSPPPPLLLPFLLLFHGCLKNLALVPPPPPIDWLSLSRLSQGFRKKQEVRSILPPHIFPPKEK